jgi:hypothetical protein
MRPRYTFGKLIFDCVMVFFTGGIWLIWMFNRQTSAR